MREIIAFRPQLIIRIAHEQYRAGIDFVGNQELGKKGFGQGVDSRQVKVGVAIDMGILENSSDQGAHI